MTHFRRHLATLAGQYGMLAGLLLLCGYYSIVTVRHQRPSAGDAARQIAGRAKSGSRAVIVAQSTEEDAVFVSALESEFKTRGVTVVAKAQGEPRDARLALESAAAGSPIACIATTADCAAWSILQNAGTRFPALGQPEILTPKSVRWPTFLTRQNLLNVANQIAVVAILAVGLTVVIITGGIDLSVGSLIALSAVLSTVWIRDLAGAMRAGTGALLLCSAAAIGICAVVGLFSGTMVAAFKVPPFIATLAVMQVASGLAFIAAKGASIYEVPDSFAWLGRSVGVLGIPNAVWLMLLLYVAAHLMMSRTVWGRRIYAVGGNAQAARLSGVNVGAVLLIAYGFSGAMAGLGGVLQASQLKSGAPTYGMMYELYAIAAVVVGGTSLSGGEGKIFGTLIGALIIAVIQNGMNLTGVESYRQKVVLGAVILGAVLLDLLKKRDWRSLAGAIFRLPSRRKAHRAVVIFLVAAGLALNTFGAEARKYSEPFRPQFHFTPEKNWMNDPNGMVFYDGEFHLFYQYNPFGDKWGHMSWGHAVSPDMVHWKHLPLALPEEDGIMIFSGSAVVDWKNSSGFGRNGKPPLVAIYTGHRPTDNVQSQCIAFSNDKGRTWTKHAGNPVINLNAKDFRDPKVQWHEPTRRWVMTVSLSAEHKVRFYGSTNLKEWTLLSEFGPAGATSGVWECPDLFELSLEGTRKKYWVLVVNIGSGSVAGGSGGQYFVGQFDGTRFTPVQDSERPLWFDYGKDYYAAVSWSDVPKSDGRRLWLGWMSNWQYAQDVPTSPWRSAMSLPREVSLRETRDGLRLVQKPVRELAKLRGEHHRLRRSDIAGANAWLNQHGIRGDNLELSVEFDAIAQGMQGLKVLKGATQETVIGIDYERGRVFVDRTRSGATDFHPRFTGVHEAPLGSQNGKVRLQVFVDACSVEVFVNDGEVVFTDLVFPSAESRGVEFFGGGKTPRIRVLNVWKLESSWK